MTHSQKMMWTGMFLFLTLDEYLRRGSISIAMVAQEWHSVR